MTNLMKHTAWRFGAAMFLAFTTATSALAQTDLQSANKQLVTAAYDKVFIAGRWDLADQYFHEHYIQHNPDLPTGRAGLVGYMKVMRGHFPSLKIKLTHVVAEGDKVTVFSEWELANPAAKTKKGALQKLLMADVYRVEGGKLAEHWDVIQVMP